MPILGPIVAWIIRILAVRLVGLAVTTLLGLGLSFTSYKFGVAPFRDMISSHLATAGASVLNWLGFLGVDAFITIILSAITVKYIFAALKVGLSALAKGA